MIIRQLSADDYSQWLSLWDQYQSFYHVNISTSVTEETYRRFLDPDEPIYCLVMESDGVLLGIVHYIFHRSTWTVGNYCYLQDLFVDPKQRAHGLGEKLIDAVSKDAKANECSRVYWLTQETNYRARALYDRVADNAGFIQYRKNL
ncbi:GNAT family N-acetyltransferase [Acinetobacter sp. B10A]|uniref:GNAT family N-acetyltransferase n=1 Tax=Acinetobacter baretiae TaxID=2605383 RepID=UPI001B3C8A70|nr:GNAT family N-acetyltransferase [Acinetobacter baretiae]MBF7686550.1 GNAT family N-acetyltransferase [Acinetobacter baretiae]